ncbi:NAD(+) diphosphatase [Novosphingobium sp. 1949]|uniref:NAD(+) diphosphatase n=1 Tax=Novosphingobium organovorum TaxID=2930092 RepID=A0ABT0BEQ6_9SPHN|nr:NAD(+) diphosphatase [Novosphingobium organovorum]MCJ2183547.1 NAD(+) diphosphatase [Novosphingobium organovorum]
MSAPQTLSRPLLPIAYAGSPLDRADPVRNDPAALAALKTERARVLLLDGLDPVLSPDQHLSWGTLDQVDEGAELIFLGIEGLGEAARGCFAPVPTLAPGESPHAGPASWNAMAVLGAGELATYGGARSLVSWHARHRFCPQCGSPTRLDKGGWQRTCTSEACGAAHFPRVDPVTIMAIEHEGKLLLGRQPRFPEGRYSTLAGFLEPGETMEEAVMREVFEEAGVRVKGVSYVASQPWPFPSSLMLACHGYALSTELTMDASELEDLRWFTRADILDALEAKGRGEPGRAFDAPAHTAVAHVLMRWWVDRTA